MQVTNAEVDPRQHDGYLDIIAKHAGPLGQAMLAMGTAAGTAARSLAPADFVVALGHMQQTSERASTFLDALTQARCPAYLRGADDQLQDALKLLVDSGRRGVEAASSANGPRLIAAAAEMEVANRDIVTAAHRLSDWRSGAARP